MSGNKLFVPGGLRTHVSDDEILTRFLVAARLQGLAWPAVRRELEDRTPGPKEDVWVNLSWVLFVSDFRYRAELVPRAAALWPRLDVRRELLTRRLDYLIERGPIAPALRSVAPAARIVFSAGPWTLVRVAPG